MGSRQISALAVVDFLLAHLGAPGLIPGTPQWCMLSDTDPRKWQACGWAAIWWCIAEEGRQEALAEASKAVAASAEWPKGAREIQQLDAARKSGVRIERVSAHG